MNNPLPRITDENAVVKFLKPDDPLLSRPNKITEKDFTGWTQERGLYFWTQFDELRVDHDQRLASVLLVVGDIEHDQAPRHADLDCSQSDAGSLVHGLQHIVDQPAELGVDPLDRDRSPTQQGIW